MGLALKKKSLEMRFFRAFSSPHNDWKLKYQLGVL